MEASSRKGGEIERRKKKVLARRSEREKSLWLSDLSTWVMKADPKPEDPIFTNRVAKMPGA